MRPSFLYSSLTAAILLASVSAHAAVLTSTDFNKASPWVAITDTNSPTIVADVDWKPVGTIDVANTATPSGALLMAVNATGKNGTTWDASLISGPLKIKNTEADLAKLTLGFMLSASSAKPVTVHMESINAAGKSTGELTGVIYPAAPNFYQRYSLDLSTLKQVKGKFNPLDPAVQLTFTIAQTTDGTGWPLGEHQLRLDNVNYSSPAYYVSTTGKDSNNGRTEKTAFATPQAALNVAQPGDIILVGQGTYNGGLDSVAKFITAGTPADWIVLKAAPGQTPTFTSNGWNIVGLQYGGKGNIDTEHTLAYIEIRGLHVLGENDIIAQKFPEALGKPDGRSNTNCIAVDGRYMQNAIHHIRMADNVAEHCPGQGMGAIEADWITIENNISRNNCWTTIFATSGYSVMGATNFDTSDNVYKDLIRNNVSSGNETKQQWGEVKRISDGNGIILDVNQNTASKPNQGYIGRTLVVGNLSFNNGGSGIHAVRADRIDIINNTAYLNSASPALQYSQIYTYGSKDVHIMNNILVAPVANLEAGEKPEPVNKLGGKNVDVVYSNNIYFGGNIPPSLGEGDKIADPLFVNPSRDPKVADFHLKADSPARAIGASFPALPIRDMDGRSLPVDKPVDVGVYQFSK